MNGQNFAWNELMRGAQEDQRQRDRMRREAEEASPSRCPDCGTWLSTRYSGGPHRCVADLAVQPANQRDFLPVAAGKPTHAPAHGWGSVGPGSLQGPPAARAAHLRAMALAWVAGALSGALVSILAASLLWIR